MRVLIIGGAGFIGSRLAEGCLAQGLSVRVFNRPSRSVARIRHLDDRMEIRYGDFLDDFALSEALTGVDAVVHALSTTVPQTMARSAVYDASSNLIPTIRLVEGCLQRNIRNLVYLSSGGTIYGEANYLPIDEDHPKNPISLYGLSKLGIENYLHFIAQREKMDIKVLRVSNVYGPGQNYFGLQGVIGVALGCLLRNQPFTLLGNGENLRDYVHIDDVVSAVLLALRFTKALTVNIGTETGTSTLEVLELLEKITERKLCIKNREAPRGDILRNVLANARARYILQWIPRTAFSEGLNATVKDELKAEHID